MAGTDLAQLLLKQCVTVVLLLLVLRLLSGASAARRVFAARCGVVALLLMPLAWLALPSAAPAFRFDMSLAVSALVQPPLEIPAIVTTAVVPDLDHAVSLPARGAQWGRWLLAAYVFGVAWHLLRLAAGVWRLYRAAAQARALVAQPWVDALARLRTELGLRRQVCLLVDDMAVSPYSWGWRTPVIVLDHCGVDSADPDAMLAHELAHIRAYDWPMLLLARVLFALYWWHPLMYPLRRMLEHDTECAADDAVLAAGVRPSHYAHTLLTVSRQVFGGTGGTVANRIASRGAMLVARIAALLEARRPRGRVSARQWWGGALATLALVGLIGNLQWRGEQVLWPDALLPAAGGGHHDTIALLAALDNPNFRQLAVAMRAAVIRSASAPPFLPCCWPCAIRGRW